MSFHFKGSSPKFSNKTIIALSILALLVPTIYVVTRFARSTSAAWFDESWSYRQAINIPSHTSSEDDVYVTAPTFDATDTTRYQADCGDLRFTTQAGDLLPYYVVDCDATADIHVNFPTLPAGASTYYMYYGNPAADNGFSASDFSTAASGLGTQTTDSEELSPGPIAHWKFDEGYGTTTHNSGISGSTLDGIFDSNAPEWVNAGYSQKAIQCTAANSDHIDIGDIFNTETQLTISTWINPNSLTSNSWLIGEGGIFRLELQSDGDLALWIRGYNASSVDVSDTLTVTAGINISEWSYITATWNGDTQTRNIYVNGKLVGTDSSSVVRLGSWDSNNATICDGYNNLGSYYDGLIDEFKLYPYARSSDQILADYNARGTSGGTSAMLGANRDNDPALSNGLVGYWKMDETASPALDSSGNDNTGTWINDTTSATGKFGNGTTYDGTGDSFNISTSTELNHTTNGSFSIGLWVKPDTLSSAWRRSLILQENYLTSGYRLGFDNGGAPRFWTTQSGGTLSVLSSTTMTISQWNYIFVTYDNQRAHLYLNGELVGSSTGTYIAGSNSVRIGHAVSEYYSGELDETRIYNRALSPVEVRKLYNWAPGPVAHYKMDEGTGTTVNDTSGNGNTATFTGSPSWTQGKYGSGVSTDNTTSDYINAPNIDINDNWTAMSWFQYPLATTGSSWHTLFRGNSGDHQILVRRSDMLLGMYDTSGGNFRSSGFDFDTLSTGWHHITTVGTGSIQNFYIDGVYVGQSDTKSTTDIKGIGNHTGGSQNWGTIDDVRIYDYARTPGQIIEDMNAGHPLGGSSISSKIGHWKFDKGYGTTAHNSGYGGSALDGTITAALWKNKGKIGKTLSFDGATSKVEVPDFDHESDQQYTLSTWINYSGGQATYLVKNTSWNNGFNFWGSASSLYFRAGDGTNATNLFSGVSTGSSNNTWFHLVVTRNGDTWKLYVDGILKSTATDNTIGDTNNSGALKIGNYETVSWDPEFQGMLDEVKIYSTALTQEEILIDMNQGSAMVLGSLSDTSGLTGGSVASSSASSAYCVPGDTTSCAPPIGEWKFEEKTGTTAYDTSGNGYDGILTNSPSWTNGKIGSALEFNSTDYISTSLDIYDLYTAGGFTIEAWSYHTATGSYDTILSSFKHTPYDGMFLRTDSGGTNLGCYMYNAGSSNGVQTTNEQNVWIHWTCSYSGGVLKLYKNGKYITQDASASMSDPANTILIGANYTGNENWEGKLDDVRIYDYARTPAQVAYDYNRGGPVGHWKLDECQGTTSYDSSGNDNHGTVTIGATGTNTTAGTCTTSGAWYDGVTGKLNSSLDFDGTDDYTVIPDNDNLSSTDISVSGWYDLTNNTTGYSLYKGTTSADREYAIGATNSSISARFFNNGSGSVYNNLLYTKTLTGWHHVVATYTDSTNTGKLYVDGVLVDTDTADITMTNQASTLNIGRYGGGSLFYNGQIDDVQIFNYALTPTQVKQVMNQSSAIRFGPTL